MKRRKSHYRRAKDFLGEGEPIVTGVIGHLIGWLLVGLAAAFALMLFFG